MCRSFLSVWKDAQGNEVSDGRNNLGVVSINLPRIALEASSIDHFFEILDERLDLCHKALRHRYETSCKANPENAPLIYMEGAFGKRLPRSGKVKELFNNNRASISLGYIGIHHVVTHLLGVDKVIGNTEAEELGLEIVTYLRTKVDQWKLEEDIGYSLYSTPSEGLCDRFLRLDRSKFGVVKNVTDREYYINSFHLDPREPVSPFERIVFEYKYQFIATGGFITYTELPKMENNLKGLEAVVDYGIEKCGYFACNQPVDHCLECGSTEELKPTSNGYICTKCGCTSPEKLFAIRRVSGYLSQPVQRPVNNGKTHEYEERVKNSLK